MVDHSFQGMKVALVRCADRSSGETNVTGCYPPLGLAYLGAVLRDAGHDPTIIDAKVLALSNAEIASALPRDTQVIGITATTLGWPAARDTAEHARAAFPDALLVLGGPHVTAFPKVSLEASAFDIGVLGDGEDTLVELCRRHSEAVPLNDLPGCVVRDGSTVRLTDAVQWIDEIDRIPFPALDLLPMDRYRCVMVEHPFASMITSRGCPYRCDFCSQVYSGSTLRSRSAENIVDEMAALVENHEAKEVLLFDETFGARRSVALRVCELIRERGLRMRWNARTRIDVVDRELLEAMRDAGCYAIHLGIESGTQRVLEMMNKRITLDAIRRAVALAREVGFQTHAYFMIGYPGETRDEIESTLRFSRNLGLDWASYTITIPNPHTPLCERAERDGHLPVGYWESYTRGEQSGDPVFFTSDECSAAYLRRAKRRAYFRFYMRPGTLLRNTTFFLRRGGFGRIIYAAGLWLREAHR